MRQRLAIRHTAAMGKLAERLADLQSSGIYRVAATEALEEAVALDGFALVRVNGLQTGPNWQACLTPRDDGRVLLISGCAALPRRDAAAWDLLMGMLSAAAVEHRAAGLRFFAVFLDPDGELPVESLYNGQRATTSNSRAIA